MIAQTLECGKQRFVDTETNFVLGANPICHSFEIAELFLTFFFVSPHEDSFKLIANIEKACKYRLDRHEPSLCHPEDIKITWIKEYIPSAGESWVNHKHLWFNKKESREDAIVYALALIKPYMAPAFWDSIVENYNV